MENFSDLIFNNNCDIDGGLRKKKYLKSHQ